VLQIQAEPVKRGTQKKTKRVRLNGRSRKRGLGKTTQVRGVGASGIPKCCLRGPKTNGISAGERKHESSAATRTVVKTKVWERPRKKGGACRLGGGGGGGTWETSRADRPKKGKLLQNGGTRQCEARTEFQANDLVMGEGGRDLFHHSSKTSEKGG